MLVGCGGQPRPDPVTAHVLVDTAAPLECPEPDVRIPPQALTDDVVVATPTPLPAGEGDYGVTRAGWEMLVDGMRALQIRVALWKAWAHDPR